MFFYPLVRDGFVRRQEEIRTLMQIAELTGSKAATLTGLKDSPTVRRWIGGEIPPFLFGRLSG